MDWNAIAQRLQTRPPFPLGQGQSSAVLALIAGDRLILEVRSQALRHQPGEICLPGGRMEPGESPMHAALRETREELGIDPQGIQMVGSLAILLHADRRAVFPVLAHCAPSVLESLQPNPAEVEEVFTVENVRLQDIPARYCEAFSLILCNPPYERGGFAAADAEKALCKKEIALPLEDLCAAASRCLKFGGRFALIHRADRLAELVYTLHARRLEVKKIRPVCGKAGDKPYAVLVAAVKGGKPGAELLPALVNEKE